jgi:phosphodiester glycosidase/flagellar hook capping protein FlgD
VLRQLLVTGLLAAVAVTSAQADPVTLMPGVTVDRQVQFTPHGPVGFTVITGPPSGSAGGLYTLGPVLAAGTVRGASERVTDLEREVSGTSTAVGINGDFTSGADGHANGIVVAGGAYEHGPSPARSSIAIDTNGTLHASRISFAGTWRGTGQRRPVDGINQTPRGTQTILFTPAWGGATPDLPSAAAVVLEPFPSPAPNSDLTAAVASAATGPVGIPPDGAVLVATGGDAAKLQAEAPQGTSVTVRLILPPSLGTVTGALGGGPLLVRNGRAVFHTNENFATDELAARNARAAVGQLADGRVVLVAVDGAQPGYSTGMTTYDLAQTMARLGAQTAVGLAYGKPVTAAFDGQLLSRPADRAGAPVKEGLLLQYVGVYAPPPSVPVIGKQNQTAVEQLVYKVVRPSDVTASVVGPDGTVHPLDTGNRQPGIYRFTWNTYDLEGTWHWNVKATDDLGRASVADQTFRYDLTLSRLLVPAASRPPVKAGFTLSRPATATLLVETNLGTVVEASRPVPLDAGVQSLTWDGNTTGGAPAPAGSYVVRVVVTSPVGTMDLSAPLTLRR